MINLYDYTGGISEKQLVAMFEKDCDGKIMVHQTGVKSECVETLWGDFMRKRDYVNNVFVRLYHHWPQDNDKVEYRYVYDYSEQKTPVACIVKKGDVFGYSVVSDKRSAVYKGKILLPEEIESHRFCNGEYISPIYDSNGVLSTYLLQTPTSWAADAFNYKTARQIAHNHLGQNVSIPRRLITTRYGNIFALDDVINEITSNWWTV